MRLALVWALFCAGMVPVLFEPARPADAPENAAYTAVILRFADMESLRWNADGVSLRLQYAPAPQQSLLLFRNGIVQTGNADFTTNGNRVFPRDPQKTDLYVAWYRY